MYKFRVTIIGITDIGKRTWNQIVKADNCHMALCKVYENFPNFECAGNEDNIWSISVETIS